MEIRTFGGLRILRADQEVGGLGARKAQALLVYLACTGRSQAREVLAELLWDDRTQSQAQGNLRRELTALRQNVGEYLEIDRRFAGMNPTAETWLDVAALETGLQETDGAIRSAEIAEKVKQAVALYQGPFLEGFHIFECRGFQEWLLSERERTHCLVVDALQKLIDFYIANENYTQGISTARRLLELDSLVEAGHRQLIRLLSLSEQRGAALAQYDTCKNLLAEELGVEPEPETTELYDQIQMGELSAIAVQPRPERLEISYKVTSPAFLDEAGEQIPAPLFVARQAELSRMQAALEQAQHGEGIPLFVIGGPGRGKSALLNEFARQATAEVPDLLVVRGDCSAYSGVGDPYLPFREVLAMLTGEVEARFLSGQIDRQQAERLWKALPLSAGAILDGGEDLLDTIVNSKSLAARARAALPDDSKLRRRLDEVVGQAQRSQVELEKKALFEAYTQVLKHVSARQPLVVLLDDLQWADSGSINLLFHLVRNLRGAPILIVGAYRPEEVALGRRGERHPLEKPLAEFKLQYGDIWIDLAEADRAAGRQLVDLYLDSQPNRLGETFREALFAHTGGQPLFTVELLRALQERGTLVQDQDGFWFAASELDWDALPARVEGVIEERINCLEDDFRQILTVASVEGEDFTAQVIARVQERSTRQLVGCLSGELSKVHRLVGEKGAQEQLGKRLYQYRFLHHLFQRYLYNQIGAIEREMLHQAVGDALEALYGEQAEGIAAQLAWHFEASGQGEKAVKYLQMAGDQARLLYALPEAVDHYQRAIRLMKGMNDLELAARTQMKLGLAYHNAMQFEQARAAFDQGNKLWRDLDVRKPTVLTQVPHALRVAWTGDIFDLSEHHLAIQENCFSGLVAVTADYGIRPDLAKSWEILDDGRKYIFHLREGLRWSDGQPLTAGDIEFTWKHILSSSTRQDLVSLLFNITNARAFHQNQVDDLKDVGVRAVDRSTLVVKLVKPAGYFLQMLTCPLLFPRPRHLIEQYGDEWNQPERMVASGPFQLSGFRPGEKIMLRRNQHYHGQFSGNVENLEYRSMQNLETCTAAYHSNEVDIMFFGGYIAPEMHILMRQYAGEYKAFPLLQNNMEWFNIRIKPFDDRRVRRAWMMCHDSQAWIDQVVSGLFSPPAGGMIPPGMPGYSPGIELPYDPPEARRLLAEAGYPGGRGFPEINWLIVKEYYESSEVGARDLAFMQEHWGDNLGVKINFHPVPGKVFSKVRDLRRDHFILGNWSWDYPDPHNLLSLGILSVYSPMCGWHNPSYEQLVQTAEVTMDQVQRIKLYQQANQILVQDAPCILWGHHRCHFLVKPWVKNFDGSADRFGNFSEVILEGH